MYRLFIDDERFPVNDGGCWIIARSLENVKMVIQRYGFPEYVSFDHDLGHNEPTGMDIAKFLVEVDMDHDVMPKCFDFYVHSQNPVGKTNIEEYLKSYMRCKNG